LTSSAKATVLDQGSFSLFEVFPETIVTDLPRLEGTEFRFTCTEAVRGHFVDSAQGSTSSRPTSTPHGPFPSTMD
jgi:hypothetical protein